MTLPRAGGGVTAADCEAGSAAAGGAVTLPSSGGGSCGGDVTLPGAAGGLGKRLVIPALGPTALSSPTDERYRSATR